MGLINPRILESGYTTQTDTQIKRDLMFSNKESRLKIYDFLFFVCDLATFSVMRMINECKASELPQDSKETRPSEIIPIKISHMN